MCFNNELALLVYMQVAIAKVNVSLDFALMFKNSDHGSLDQVFNRI